MSKLRAPFTSSAVPYVTDRVPQNARAYIPRDSAEVLDVKRVNAFVEGTRDQPDVRLAVLGVLRTHSMNGAETPAAVFAIALAALTMLASSMGAVSVLGSAATWAFGVLAVLGSLWFGNIAFAAHVRRVTCGVWLAAYEDALR
ncbi:hypothetical protein [Microbacterium sp. NPDC096154]|uniref:hypothetical protein n=1 Tax=Microbacterium sp. NPDC096154 TaxID=3155549 RepID=UPI00331EC44F